MRKYVTLFGRTGCGKSSIANMLVQGDIYRNNNKFTIGHGAEGETVRVRSYFTEKYQVFDMVGLSEPSSHLVSHKKAAKTVRNYFSDHQLLLNYIFYVQRKGRISEEDVKMFKLFKETFKGGEKNFIIIITHSKPGWITDNLEIIRKNFGNYPIISVDFPLTDEDEDDIIASDKRKRVQSLQRLEDGLSELKYSAVELEVLSSTQIIEKKVSKIVSIIPIAGSLYQLIASGVYYKLGKPKHAKERLIDGIIGVTLDVVGMAVARPCKKSRSIFIFHLFSLYRGIYRIIYISVNRSV
jgi:GTP-binding protein EngB required for normal cell division